MLGAPAVFTPGDNDWTDCDRANNGGFNSLERLDLERRCSSTRTFRSAGFQEYLSALRAAVIAFRKPVAYVHGDSDYFRVDKPFLDALGRRLENFTRVETFGDNQQNGTNDVHWLKVIVDVQSREVFSYEPQMVPANRVAVPQP
jgi:hypothetical protein